MSEEIEVEPRLGAVPVSPLRGGAAFLLAVLVGGASLAASRSGALASLTVWLIPTAVMLLFAGTSFSSSRSRGALSELGDSFYYLGFTFTLLSLLLAVGLAQSDGDLLPKFASAVATTVLGVVGRVFLYSLASAEAPRIADPEQAMQRQMAMFLSALEQATNQSRTLIAETLPKAQNELTAHLQRAGDAVGRIAGQVDDAGKGLAAAGSGAQQLADSLSELLANIKTVAASIQAQGADVSKQLEVVASAEVGPRFISLGEHLGRLSGSAVDAGKEITELSTSVLGGLKIEVGKLSDTMIELHNSLSFIKLQPDRLMQAFNGIATEIEASDLTQKLATLASTITLVSTPGLPKTVEELQKSLASANAALMSLGALGERVDSLGDHVKQIDATLADIEQAIKLRLERIR